MTTKKTISILGCGWLGLALAKQLIASHYHIKGSTTSQSKMPVLINAQIDAFLIALEADAIHGKISEFLEGSDLLIIDIPPKLRSENSESFVAKMKMLIPFIEKSTVSKVLFISSTSVYADDDSVVTENKLPNPDTESGRQLFESEQLLMQNQYFKSTILRFGGLIGSDRHPIKHLAGRENIENPNAPINLIHQKDCIRIILKIIASEKWHQIYNAAAPFHPTREDYYVGMAKMMDLDLPMFNHQKKSVGKTIDATKLQQDLNFTFDVPEL